MYDEMIYADETRQRTRNAIRLAEHLTRQGITDARHATREQWRQARICTKDRATTPMTRHAVTAILDAQHGRTTERPLTMSGLGRRVYYTTRKAALIANTIWAHGFTDTREVDAHDWMHLRKESGATAAGPLTKVAVTEIIDYRRESLLDLAA